MEYVARSGGAERFPELCEKRVDFVAPILVKPAIALIAVDERLAVGDLQHCGAALTAALEQLPEAMRVGFITYGNSVAVYELADPALVLSDVYRADATLANETRELMKDRATNYVRNVARALPCLRVILEALVESAASSKTLARALPSCLEAAVRVALALVEAGNELFLRLCVRVALTV